MEASLKDRGSPLGCAIQFGIGQSRGFGLAVGQEGDGDPVRGSLAPPAYCVDQGREIRMEQLVGRFRHGLGHPSAGSLAALGAIWCGSRGAVNLELLSALAVSRLLSLVRQALRWHY